MIALALATVLFAGPAVDVRVAPDQPLPFVYDDEPLVIEFFCTQEVTCTAAVHLEFAGGPSETFDLGSIHLRPSQPQWQAVDLGVAHRGNGIATVTVDTGQGRITRQATFCRVARPSPMATLPAEISLDDFSHRSLLALGGVRATAVRFNAAQEGVDEDIAAAAAGGLAVAVNVSFSETSWEEFRKLFDGIDMHVTRWDVDLGDEMELLPALTEYFQQGASHGKLSLRVGSREQVQLILSAEGAADFRSVVLAKRETVHIFEDEIRRALEWGGREGIRTLCPYPYDSSHTLSDYLAGFLVLRAKNIVPIVDDGTANYTEGELGVLYPFMSAFTVMLEKVHPVGPLFTEGSFHGYVFRKGRRWLIAYWSDEEEETQNVLVGAPTHFEARDALNRPFAAPDVLDGSMLLTAYKTPRFIIGEGGEVLVRAARAAAQSEAEAFESSDLKDYELPPELVKIMGQVAAWEVGDPPSMEPLRRFDFLLLLRMFLVLEQWHLKGVLEPHVATAALASTNRLLDALCVMEEEVGEPFLEPINGTAAFCQGVQDRHRAAPLLERPLRGRAEWLSTEVNRLVDAALELRRQGRENEAKGVVAMAEWRARALEFIHERSVKKTAPEE